MLIALVLIVGVWNRASTFRAAYAQTAVFLVVMNWFDGIIIDRAVGRPQQNLAHRGDGGRPLCEAVENPCS